jgi:hypothetical protein
VSQTVKSRKYGSHSYRKNPETQNRVWGNRALRHAANRMLHELRQAFDSYPHPHKSQSMNKHVFD